MRIGSAICLIVLAVAKPCWALDPPTFLFKFGSEGSGPGQFSQAVGFCVAPNGHVYVADYGNSRVDEFDGDGVFIRSIGNASTLPGSALDVAVRKDGTMFVASSSSIAVFDASAHPLPSFQAPGSSGVCSLALDATEQYLYAMYATGEIQQFDMLGNRGYRWYATAPNCTRPGLGMDASGEIVVVSGTCSVSRFQPDGTQTSGWSVPTGYEPGYCSSFRGLAMDVSDRVYVADDEGRIEVFSADGAFLTQYGTKGTADGQFALPMDIGFGIQNRNYVLDGYLGRIDVFAYGITPVRRQTWGKLKLTYR